MIVVALRGPRGVASGSRSLVGVVRRRRQRRRRRRQVCGLRRALAVRFLSDRGAGDLREVLPRCRRTARRSAPLARSPGWTGRCACLSQALCKSLRAEEACGEAAACSRSRLGNGTCAAAGSLLQNSGQSLSRIPWSGRELDLPPARVLASERTPPASAVPERQLGGNTGANTE